MKFVSILFFCSLLFAGAQPKFYIIGDSTASNGTDRGWGSHLQKYIDASEMRVINRARAGRSSRTFLTEGLWGKVAAGLQAGDYVLIQFGHNDGSKPGEGKDRGSLRGLGEDSVDIKGETVHTYGWYLRKYIADVRAKGAIPVIASLTVRNEWRNEKVERGPGSYSQWAEDVARSESVTFVDVNNIIGLTYERMGAEAVKPFFPEDHTHTSPEGADLNARCVIAGLKALPGQPFDHVLTEAGDKIAPDAAGKSVPSQLPGELTPNHDPKLPTVFFIGDSTVKNSRDAGSDGLWGWAHPIASHFDRTRINVENEALGGMSSRTFLTSGHWDNVLKLVKEGDFLVMQFGHNDSSPVNDDQRARGTIKGNGDETEEIKNLLTGKDEVVHSYGWYLRKFVEDAKARGATAIICSPVPRNDFPDGSVRRAGDSYALWARQAAESSSAFFIDLNTRVADRYDLLGKENVAELFPVDHTHTGWEGALLNAAAVVESIRNLENCALREALCH